MEHGYECRVCGHEPTERELQNGSCSHCLWVRQRVKEELTETLNDLQVGDSVQVLVPLAFRDANREQTVLLWMVEGHHPDGSLKWKSMKGLTTFLDSDRTPCRVEVRGLRRSAENYTHNTTDSVIHWVLDEMRSRAYHIIHQVRPETTAELARTRLADSMEFLRHDA